MTYLAATAPDLTNISSSNAAIVAHQMGKPLNELRFISIKEVKD